jgi:thiamine-phosphate diphosphorylase
MRPLPRLLAFTDASIRKGDHTGATAAAIAAIGPAVGFVARDHAATAAELTDFTALLMAEAHAHEAAIIVAGRPDLAAGLSAHGVQLRASDLSPSDARQVIRKGWIGRSVHSAVEGAEAVEEGADYLVAGNIWETATHPGRQPAGLGLIEALVSLGKAGVRDRRCDRGAGETRPRGGRLGRGGPAFRVGGGRVTLCRQKGGKGMKVRISLVVERGEIMGVDSEKIDGEVVW